MIRTSTAMSILAGCLLAAPGPAAAISINEVLYDATGSDNGRVFVELYGTAGTVLDGWSIEGINGSDGSVTTELMLNGTLPADGFFVIADQNAGTTEVLGADLLLDFDFQNGPDSVVLRDAAGAVVDALGYGTFAAGDSFAGEGSPANDPPSGHSMERRFAGVDTDDNAADFAAREFPTPGAGAIPLPEPRPGLILVMALAGLGVLRRACRA